MTRQDAAARLERYALCLDLLDEDPFRARAFVNAARSLEAQTESLDELSSSGRLETVKGVGKAVAAAIRELQESGTFGDLARAEQRVPSGVFDLLRVDGLGPKKARALWKDANIVDLGALERAIHEGRLQRLAGFGAKTADKYLQSVAFLRSAAGRHLRHHALNLAEQLRSAIVAIPEVRDVIFGGSLARGMETIGDLDTIVVAASAELATVRNSLRSLDSVNWSSTDNELWQGVGPQGFEIELSVIPPEQIAARTLLCTGSKPHYRALRELAQRRGFKLEADRLTRADGAPVHVETDADIYLALGLEPVPAALREDEGTLVSRGSFSFPQPVQLADFRGILHCHSTYSDGHHTLRELAEAMSAGGYSFLGIADHSKAAAYANGLAPDRVRAQWREIDNLNREFAPFRILKGTECDILADGRLDFDDELLAGFDFVVASIHSGFNMTEDDATTRLCRALENPHVDVLGHPTGRLLLERPGYPVDPPRLIEHAARYGKAIELNANPYRLDLDWRWIAAATAAGVPLPINPDAHRIEGLLDIRYGVDVAAKGPLTARDCPSTWPAEQFLEWCESHENPR
ncbi:DNA polymerase/3'-5' exonuclease PolX [candidate division KSB1 bacterium]|nr:DNA polymerase/3'-5' exonuclease PolX [candidate division KSB1 bacterium]